MRRPATYAFAALALACALPATAAPTPRTTLEIAVRPTYKLWVTGSAARADLDDVFPKGPGLAFDALLRLGHAWGLYFEWERLALGVGTRSPYARLPSSQSGADDFLLGVRHTGSGGTNFLVDLALGYWTLWQRGSDGVGGSAEVALPSLAARGGLGLSFRAARWLGIEPVAFLTLGRTSSVSSSVCIGGCDLPCEGSTA